MPHERITGVGIGEREHTVLFACKARERLAFIDGDRERLVADDVNARLEKRRRDACMKMIRGDDRDRVDTVFASGFVRGHLVKIRVAARKSKLRGTDRSTPRIGGQRTRHEFEPIVDTCRNPVHRADERAIASP